MDSLTRTREHRLEFGIVPPEHRMELEQLLSSRRNEPDPFPTQPVQNYNVLGCGYDPEQELPAMRVHASFLGVWEWGCGAPGASVAGQALVLGGWASHWVSRQRVRSLFQMPRPSHAERVN